MSTLRKMLDAVYDYAQAEVRNMVLHLLAAAPGSPAEGQIWYNTVSHNPQYYNGTSTVDVGSGGGSGTVTSVAVATANGFAGSSDGNSSAPTVSVKLNFTSGMVKAGSGGAASAATAGTDYAVATTGSSALKGNGSGGFGTATINDLGAQTADYSAASHKFTNVVDPSSAQDAATKNYVDNLVNGVSWKQAVRAATTANGTLASAYANGSTVDGVTLATNDRILVMNQTTGSENGIYTVNASGAPTRAVDAATAAQLKQATTTVMEGTANADKTFTMTNDGTVTVGTTALVFVLSGTGSVAQGTSSTQGKLQLATQTEADARTDTAKAVTPADLGHFLVKKTFTIGDGSTTDITVTHSLGTDDIMYSVRDASTGAFVDCGMTTGGSTSTATFSFRVAPASNAYKVVIAG